MSGSLLHRIYDFHGIGLEVSTDTPAVLEAMELRLRGFRDEPAGPAQLRLEFVVEDDAGLPPPGSSRPVYDTPYGAIHYAPDADALHGDLAGVRLRCDASAGVARFFSDAFGGRALYLATHPLATISLMELLKRRGRYALHAACLEEGGRGVLLAGPTGAGKSTLTLALVRAGLAFASDDVVFLSHHADRVTVLGFSDTLGITEDTAARFPELAGFAAAAPEDGFPKRLVRMEDAFASAPVLSCEPRVLVFPEVARNRSSALTPLDPKEAWLRLVPDVLLTQPAGTQAHLHALAALLAQVRCFRLRSGADLKRSVQLVRDVLSAS